MNYKTLGLVGLLLISCNRQTTFDKESNESQTTQNITTVDPFDGAWTDGSEPNASFSIDNDSIRDVEHSTKTKFEMSGDSVTFFYDYGIVKAKMYKTHVDTLVYEYDGIKTKYWRFND
jgi:hypothetical protein